MPSQTFTDFPSVTSTFRGRNSSMNLPSMSSRRCSLFKDVSIVLHDLYFYVVAGEIVSEGYSQFCNICVILVHGPVGCSFWTYWLLSVFRKTWEPKSTGLEAESVLTCQGLQRKSFTKTDTGGL